MHPPFPRMLHKHRRPCPSLPHPRPLDHALPPLSHAVTKPREQAIDSQLFATVTESGVEYVKGLARGGKVHARMHCWLA
jgi:hypothetical protein